MLATNNNNNNIFQSNSSIINESELYQQKRIRAGSISGRLRAASNLEECGIIDKAQKGIIKDLIIGGDPLIQKALDKYESGDPSDLKENKGIIGAYTIEQRKKRIEKFLEKRNHRVWTKKVKYDVRKNFADSRLRVKGRFVKKEEEHVMRELLDM
eukprot:gene22720-29415_t